MAARSFLNIHSVFLKLAAMIVLSIISVVAVLEYLTARGFDQVIAQSVESKARSETQLFASAVAGAVRFDKKDVLGAQLEEFIAGSDEAMRSVDVYDADLELFYQAGATSSSQTSDLARQAVEQGATVQDPETLQTAQPLVFGQDQAIVGVIVTSWSTAKLQAMKQEILNSALLIAAAVCALAVGLVTYAIHRLAKRPLLAAQADIARLEAKDFDFSPTGIGRRDEFGQLARAIDALRGELAAGEENFRQSLFKSAALDQSSAALMLLDENYTITQISSKLVELFEAHSDGLKKMRPNFDIDRIIGMNISDLYPTDDVRENLRNIGHSSLEGLVRMDDTRITISTRAVFDDQGAVTGYVVEWTDVTPIWRQQALISTIDDIQIKAEFAMDGLCREANDRFSKAISIGAPGTLRLQSLLAPMAAETGKPVDVLMQEMKTGTPVVGQLKLSGAGEEKIVDGSLSCIRDTDGFGLSYLLLGTDITEKERSLMIAAQEREASEVEKSEVVEALGIGLRSLSDGDLTATIAQAFPGRYEQLRADFNQTADKLAAALREISENAESIRNESGDITNTADSLSRRTESTAATLEQTAAALDELTNALKAAAEGASQADKVVKGAHRKAEASGEVVIETVSAMDAIAQSSDQITSIIRVIDDIAFQTNLLALNAGVEAARAGDAGRGFAVVASEVRALAQRSSEAAREINGLIADSGGQVKKGVELVGQTGEALQDIVSSVTEIAGLVSEIAGSAQSQSLSLEEINVSVNKLDQSTQQNAARLEETTAASEALRNNAASLVQTLSHFRTGAAMHAKRPGHSDRPQPVAAVAAASGGGNAQMSHPPLSGDAAKWVDF
ncbi:Methyl-accepting chemotaxis protein II [Roseivivax sp. THAF40]|uniref:methyl-accepting chemotaxis protein n=1 Tax=unclassified Roseivivax TaxID=2639302 RepID=UPI001268CE50|nr:MULTISPECIES: methyl-accepting chemotaxis protein [unclassified Roseivivax]QFS83209.1 Methyl-accepting chemotaxis protein II [Roseivivax sp. THAF197b]QFT46953.1 Methyl-accepting chemotaxis protein II [Roseivivax sp. THAF40]